MALDITQVFNRAISACGSRASVAIYTENSREANLCRQWYDHCREMALAAAPWDSATGYSRLATLVERDDSADWVSTDPAPGYLYAYAAPSDMVRPRSTSTFSTFRPGVKNGAKAIFANELAPILLYTLDQTNPALWEAGLKDAIIFSLAAYIVRPLTGSAQNQQTLIAVATEKVLDARSQVMNDDNGQGLETNAPWITARGYAEAGPSTRYIYPPAEFGVSSFSLAK